ncbi:uncharacterized protein KNAG_0L00560 [Huiozyma naganishii CBS 8797]|uniref:Uncharacterized protein n=1 Tax=Huiozyma naganishii (strain ATCC MYA-139 / BCRC 22969 / CBS 8797 / KCTC 17520 / NBRC 10181 / NCYC 3082 / Yp74L-3) TaxID=1071383 RepID=J7SAE2_HUIN7|nr:hypothetical protein KNAG_0L00560 [Kazachstania naganishii CBS 8797]CCK72679.1 hypothetical protein KNAG_0L00560 [Kazachstania naganishii CBS 8797]
MNVSSLPNFALYHQTASQSEHPLRQNSSEQTVQMKIGYAAQNSSAQQQQQQYLSTTHDESIAMEARRRLNFKKSFLDDPTFYPEISSNQPGPYRNNKPYIGNVYNQITSLSNMMMSRQQQAQAQSQSQSQPQGSMNSPSKSPPFVPMPGGEKALKNQHFQFRQAQSQFQLPAKKMGNVSNHRSQQGDPYLMN